MSKPYFLTDIDEVVLGYNSEFYKWLDFIKVPMRASIKPEDRVKYSFEKVVMDQDSIYELVMQFNKSKTFGELKAINLSIPYLKELSRHFHIVGITSCGDEADITLARINNLNKTLGWVFYEVHSIPIDEDKTPYLLKYNPTYWVEDKPENAKKGEECGHTSLLIRRPHNIRKRTPLGIKTVNNWKEIYNIVNK